ncbi:hypothetical protein QJQ45_029273 [Haematococcus lacustris]|nr:hypothetical protein QJQ45_029273 [Haematococcus lacustris]
MAASGHPVLAVECDHLSMRWVDHVPNSDEVVELVRGVCDHHGIKCACVASHSYGTFQASRLLQLHPSYVACLCLIDPVTFLMFTGHLIRNFVYTPWVTGLTTWFISRDIHHAASVCRRFFWSDLNLWPDQLPEHAMVVLCEQDTLLPVQDVVTMLQSEAPHVEVLRHPTHRHAQFLIDLPFQSRIVDSMLHMMAKASTASPPSPKPTGAAAKAAEAAEAVWHLKPERLKSMPTDEPTDGTCCHSGDDTSCGGWVGDVTSLAGTTAIARVHRAGAASPLTQTCKVRR